MGFVTKAEKVFLNWKSCKNKSFLTKLILFRVWVTNQQLSWDHILTEVLIFTCIMFDNASPVNDSSITIDRPKACTVILYVMPLCWYSPHWFDIYCYESVKWGHPDRILRHSTSKPDLMCVCSDPEAAAFLSLHRCGVVQVCIDSKVHQPLRFAWPCYTGRFFK